MSIFDAIKMRIKKMIRSTKPMDMNEWAETHGYLSAESSADVGKWKSLPYQAPIMRAISSGKYRLIVVKKSARVGYTKILNHCIGYYIEHKPAGILMVQPTIEDAEGYSKEELASYIRDVACLSELVSDAKAKDGSNSILHKLFPGGVLSLIGANSPRGFRRISRKVVLMDEVSGYPKSAGPEGSPVKLAMKRSEYYVDRVAVAGSTPTIAGECEITRMFDETDQNYFFVPCPVCSEYQYLKFKNFRIPDDDPSQAHFECEINKCRIDQKHRFDMFEKGDFRPTAESKDPTVIGFHIWAAYSYSPNSTWVDIAREYLEAKRGGRESLQTFINTVEGEAFEESLAEKVNAKDIQGRAETYALGTAPEGVLLCVAGVDVQDNRLAIEVLGFGHEDEQWVLNYMEIYGNPAEGAVWKQLDNVLDAEIIHPKYQNMKVRAAAIDTGGHHTHDVYQYVRDKRSRNILAIKGATQRNKPAIGKPSLQDVNYKGKSIKKGVRLYTVGQDTIKNVLASRLKILEAGPKYIHFSAELSEDFYKGMVSERKIVKIKRGVKVSEWVKHNSHTRNEPWDCMVYGFAAKEFVLSKYPRKLAYAAIEKELVLKNVSKEEKVEIPASNKPAQHRRKSGGGFASSW